MKWSVLAFAIAWLAVAGCSRQEADWRRAVEADTVAAYEGYLQRFPAGAHTAEARREIGRLVDDDDWARAARLKTPEALQRYLASHPEGRHAAEARGRLTALVPAAGASRNWSVQLGAYSTEASAQADLARIARAQGPFLHGLKLRILEPGAAALWRLRAGALDEPGARQLCADLAAEGVSCVPVAEPISP